MSKQYFIVKVTECIGEAQFTSQFLVHAKDQEDAWNVADKVMQKWRGSEEVQQDDEGYYNFGEIQSEIEGIRECSDSLAEDLDSNNIVVILG